MDHLMCINLNSFPAESTEMAIEFLDKALQGVLHLQTGDDRFFFYLDSNKGGLYDFHIAPEFTYEQFLQNCDQDLKLFLAEVEDKSPALDNLTQDQIEEMSAYSFYVKNKSVDPYVDEYALAWAISGYLLSLNSNDVWNTPEIEVARISDSGQYINEHLRLKNISSVDHGIYHLNQLNAVDLVEMVKPHYISQYLINWIEEQTIENKSRIIDKIRLALEKNFQGGEPLFKTLVDGAGLREIRFSAYSGGAIRILFKHIHSSQQAILNGFIKFSDNEGYDQAKSKAHTIYDDIDTKQLVS